MVNPQLNGPTSDDKLWGGLSYAGLVCCMIPAIVIFLMKKDESAYIKFHGLQALFFGLITIVVGSALGILGNIPIIGLVAGLVWFLAMLAFFALWVYLMIQTFTGKDYRIPKLGEWIEQNFMG